MTRDESLRAAVRDLRARTGLTQTKFADAIGKSYPQLRSYENEKAPQGEALAAFAILSRERNFDDLAEIFRSAMIEDLGPSVVRVVEWGRSEVESQEMHVPPEVQGLVQWIIDLFAKPGTREQEVLKASLMELGAKRSALLSKTNKRNAS